MIFTAFQTCKALFLKKFFYSALLLVLKAKEYHIEQFLRMVRICVFFLHLLSFPWNNTYVLQKIYEELGLLSEM